MAISNTYTYNPTRDTIITDALNLIGVLAAEESMQAADLQIGSRFLNNLLKQWGAAGLHVWKRQEAYLIPTPGQASYSLGTSGDVAVSAYTQTTISADEAIGQTTLSVTSTTGFVNGYNIIVIDDNGDNFTSTITSFTATTVTIADALTVAASSGNYVYVYNAADRIVRPLKVLSVRRRTITTAGLSSAIDVPLTNIPYNTYMELPFKANEGQYPTQFMYDPNRDSVGTLYLWVTPNTAEVIFPFTYESTLADITSANQTFDVPQEWLMALTYQLAVSLAPAYGKFTQLQAVKPLADQYYADVLSWDNETVSLSIEPDWRSH